MAREGGGSECGWDVVVDGAKVEKIDTPEFLASGTVLLCRDTRRKREALRGNPSVYVLHISLFEIVFVGSHIVCPLGRV